MQNDEKHTRKVQRIAALLIKYADHGATRHFIALHASTPGLVITPEFITNAWPEIEREIDAVGLYANRPINKTNFRASATTAPYYAARSMFERDKNVATRMENDAVKGVMLEKLEKAPHRGIAIRAATVSVRYHAFLDARDRQLQELSDLAAELEQFLVDLPLMPSDARP